MNHKEHQHQHKPRVLSPHSQLRCSISSLTHCCFILALALFARFPAVVLVMFADLAQHVLLSEPKKNPLLRSLSPLVQNSLSSFRHRTIAALSLSDTVIVNDDRSLFLTLHLFRLRATTAVIVRASHSTHQLIVISNNRVPSSTIPLPTETAQEGYEKQDSFSQLHETPVISLSPDTNADPLSPFRAPLETQPVPCVS